MYVVVSASFSQTYTLSSRCLSSSLEGQVLLIILKWVSFVLGGIGEFCSLFVG